MTRNTRPARDAYAFSLGGLTTISSHVFAPAIADDRLEKAPSERPANRPDDHSDREPAVRWGRFWLSRRHRTA